jgi:hypothetical protein
MGDLHHLHPLENDVLSPPFLRYTRYYYPVVLIVTFATALTTWGIATSKSSKPTPPPVNGIYSNNAHLKQQQNFFDGALFKRIAARFPGGIHQQKDADMKRMGVSRKATMNWLLIAVMFTFVGNSANAIMHALIKRGWWCGQDYVVRIMNSIFDPYAE